MWILNVDFNRSTYYRFNLLLDALLMIGNLYGVQVVEDNYQKLIDGELTEIKLPSGTTYTLILKKEPL